MEGEAILPHHPRLPSPECGVVHSGVDGDFRFMLRLVLWYFGILPLARTQGFMHDSTSGCRIVFLRYSRTGIPGHIAVGG